MKKYERVNQMIVREYKDKFILIEQDHHARLSGEIMKYWKDDLFKGKERKKSVEFAISNHDLGWKLFDLEPFWNDQEERPYSFIDFPVMPKTALYSYGIDLVEREDAYAALLCSNHYARFMNNVPTKEAQQFVQAEKMRQQRLIASIPDFDEQLYQYHYALLRFGDDISLYLCINEPGTPPDAIHPFFRNGINVSFLNTFNRNYLSLYFKDEQTVIIDDFPFVESFMVLIRQKSVYKKDIDKNGFIDSYKQAPYEELPITLTDRA